jgi:hypothetical protein
MSRPQLADNVRQWMETATGRELVVLLTAIGIELGARGWPVAGSCHLAASELNRFICLSAGKENARRK